MGALAQAGRTLWFLADNMSGSFGGLGVLFFIGCNFSVELFFVCFGCVLFVSICCLASIAECCVSSFCGCVHVYLVVLCCFVMFVVFVF